MHPLYVVRGIGWWGFRNWSQVLKSNTCSLVEHNRVKEFLWLGQEYTTNSTKPPPPLLVLLYCSYYIYYEYHRVYKVYGLSVNFYLRRAQKIDGYFMIYRWFAGSFRGTSEEPIIICDSVTALDDKNYNVPPMLHSTWYKTGWNIPGRISTCNERVWCTTQLACKVEFQLVNRSYSQLTFFNFFYKNWLVCFA